MGTGMTSRRRSVSAAHLVRTTFVAGMAPALLLLAAVAHAEDPPVRLTSARALGMGDAVVAVFEDRAVLYDNPAGLRRLTRTQFSVLGLRGAIDDDLPGTVEFIQDHEQQFGEFEDLDDDFYEDLSEWDDRWVGADAATYFDFARPGLGIGVFATGATQVKIDRGVYEPRVYESAYSDIVAELGASTHLALPDLLAGCALKGVWRRESTRQLTATDAADFDVQEIVDELSVAKPGFSMDLGSAWAPEHSRFAAGCVLRDGFGWIGGERIDSSLDVGGSWSVHSDHGVLRGLVVAADLRDVADDDAFGKKIHFGAEARIPILSLRAGSHQGYAAVGAGVKLPGFSLDWAWWGRELGSLPGSEDQFLHSVELRLGT